MGAMTVERESGSNLFAGTANNLYQRAKLTSVQRQEIRQRCEDGENVRDLALEYGVSTSTIRIYR